jgi:dTDP-4-dehydrorhamnose reductase
VRRQVAAARPSIVVNAAALTAVDEAETAREMAFAINRDGPAALTAACGDSGASLIHLSTDYVFDGENPAAYTEADPVNPLSVYGASKAAGESAVRQRLAQHVILRTSWVYSPVGRNFVRRCCAWARSGNGSRWSTTSRAADIRR